MVGCAGLGMVRSWAAAWPALYEVAAAGAAWIVTCAQKTRGLALLRGLALVVLVVGRAIACVLARVNR